MLQSPQANAEPTTAETRLRRNRIASVILIIAVVLVIGWTWVASPARKVDRTETTASAGSAMQAPAANDPEAMPHTLRPVWSTESSASTSTHTISPAPLVMDNSLIVAEDRGVRAISLNDGTERWHYRRDIPLCALSGSGGQVFATFRGAAGCGETVALKPDSGQYVATRKSIAADSPAAVRSNSYAGVYDSGFLELWRSDLVRVVEYGKIPASPEPKMQPHPECSIISALTRVELLAVVNNCDGHGRLVMQVANPEESRKPEVKSDIDLGPVTADMSLVSIGQDTAAVLADNRIRVFRMDGTMLTELALGETTLRPAPAEANSDDDAPRAPFTTDLPHHMTWWSPRGLLGFRPSTLAPDFEFPEATGTPAPWGEHVFMPVADGVAVLNASTLEIIGTLPLPAAAKSTHANDADKPELPVRLAVVGDTLLVQRGESVDAFVIEI